MLNKKMLSHVKKMDQNIICSSDDDILSDDSFEIFDDNVGNIIEPTKNLKDKKFNDKKFNNKSNNKNLDGIENLEMEFMKLCDELINKINKNAKEQKNDIRILKKKYKKDIKFALKMKGRKNKGKKKTGFTTDEVVPQKLAKLIGVTYGTKMPRTVLTSKVYNVIKERNLYYDEDKRVLRADDEIRQIFDLPIDVNNSKNAKDQYGFNFFNIQKYIAKCYQNDKNVNGIIKNELNKNR